MVSINASHAAAGQAAAAALGHGPKNTAPTSPTPSAPIDADVVDLSPEAVIAASDPPAVEDRGKSSQSPAHLARAFQNLSEELVEGGSFGQLVRQFAQGTPPEPPAASVDEVPVDDEVVTDVEDPVPPVIDPVEDPIVEAPAPTLDPELIAEATLVETLLNEEDEEEVPTV